ncbi:MAG: acyloxyacyl hydrolase [Chitinophagaceae bacterium]|nr:acyloxyacyl hydrolase [Chitinophagaceae bacterium]
MLWKSKLLYYLLFFIACIDGYGQADSSKQLYKRIQYPPGLLNSHFGVSIGYIHYGFSSKQLEPGFSVSSVAIPPAGVRINLIGHRFNKYLSVNIHYMRPVNWVKYKNVNGDNKEHSVWMNVAGLTLLSQLPVSKKISLYGEAGIAIITRKGFKINNVWAVKDANYISGFFEGGFYYHLNNKWDLLTSLSYSPSHKKEAQPATYFYSAGFRYNIRPLPGKKLDENKKAGYKFPRNTIQLGIATNGLGYGANNFAYKKSPIPFFWGGMAEVKSGIALHYHRNIFHAKKVFSFDWGISASFWKSRIEQNSFFTLSAFPILRFNVVHTAPADYYFYYSIAGPTYISGKIIDGNNTGRHFTFQDLLGIGSFIGKKRKLNAEIRIGHYSNGNIFPYNDGVKIPLTFCLGYCF